MKMSEGNFKEFSLIEGNVNNKTEEAENKQYVEDIINKLELNLSKTLDKQIVMAGAQKRKLDSPKQEKLEGTIKGSWVNSVYTLNDDFIPKKFNPSGQTIAQIKKNLVDTYDIRMDGISYIDGVADFSSISLANIPIADMIEKATKMSKAEYESLETMQKTELFQNIFGTLADGKDKREHNYKLAEKIAAEKQIPIPGLEKGYTAEQLKKWRIENKFSWDEQVSNGYNLVPSIIHGNLSHTGLVSTSKNAFSFLKLREIDMQLNKEKYCFRENNAPITISEVRKWGAFTKNRRGRYMEMKKVLSKNSMSIGRHRELEYDEIYSETGEYIDESNRLYKYGEKFEADKKKLSDEIVKVQSAEVSEKDKQEIINLLNVALEKLQKQYEYEVAEIVENKFQKTQENIEEMDAYIDKLEEREQSLRKILMEASSDNASEAADFTKTKKEEYEAMKNMYIDKLRLQMGQAEMQKRKIQSKQQ